MPWPQTIPVYASSSSATPRQASSFDDKLKQDFQKAEFLSIPITLLILLLAFGALLAAGIPVLLGLTSVFTAFGLTAVSSQFMATGESTQILMMLIGMAVAVDYSLFYLKREREERARGAGKLAALEAAAATSGHAVLVSGLTVMASLAGIFFLGEPESGAMAIGSILVVGVAVLGSLTVLPAVLAKLGDRVHKQPSAAAAAHASARSATPASGASCSATSCAARSSPSSPASASSSCSHCPPSACTPSRPAWTTSRATPSRC